VPSFVGAHRNLPPRRARTARGWLPLIGIGALLNTAGALALPMVLGRAVDAMVAGAHTTDRWLALAAGIITVGVAGDLVGAFAGTTYTAGTTARLRRRLVRHVLAIGPEGARRFDTGDLVTRVSGNTADAAQAGPGAVLVATAALPPIGSLVLLAVIDPWLAAAFLAGVTLVALVLRAFTRRTAEVVAEYQRTQGLLAARLSESLAGSRTVAAAGTVEREEQRVLEPLRDLRRYGERTWRVVSRSGAQAAVIGPLVLVAVLGTGGLALADGRISAGDLLAASRYAVLGAGLGGLTGVLGRVARARAGRHRVDEVLAVRPLRYGRRTLPAAPLPAAPPAAAPLAAAPLAGVTLSAAAARDAAAVPGRLGRLEFRGVAVHGTGPALLESVNLTLCGGTAVAVVGRSGAGKSVLAAVAARLRDPDAGRVLLDGVPLAELSRKALRSAIGCAFERPVLVGHTVGDAIGPGLDRDRVRAAARATHAHDFVSRLPRGYDTPLMEAPMSGGEAQRLGLARAWHAGRLLVLDDATSSLDMVTEMRIARALADHHDGRTRLIITHRAATAARSDLVVWMDQGRVRAVGPHLLLWRDPHYREVFG
jgi:ATP-binding cassette subfamily B protein